MSHHGLDNSWMERAACLGQDVNSFFEFERNPLKEQDAVMFCHLACLVREHCLIWALVMPEDRGVWGGMTEKQRRELRRRPEVKKSLLDTAV